MKKWLSLVLLGGANLSIGCERKDESPKDHAAPTASAHRWELEGSRASSIGASFVDEDFSLTATAWKLCEQANALEPKTGYARVSIPVKIASRSDSEVPVSPLSFHLEDDEGHHFPSTLAGCDPVLSHQTLKEQAELEGHVAFDIPKEKKDFELVFSPFLIGRKAVPARIRLPGPDP